MQAMERAELETSEFMLTIDIADHVHCRLEHLPSGTVLAEGPYFYSFSPINLAIADVSASGVVLTGVTTEGLALRHEFMVVEGRWIEETLELSNVSAFVIDLSGIRCGFTRKVDTDAYDSSIFTAIPFRREPAGHNGDYMDFTLRDVLNQHATSRLWDRVSFWTTPTETTSAYASEAWAWTTDGWRFVVSKYSDCGMEWALLDRATTAAGTVLRWGGIGAHQRQPERGLRLNPGIAHRWGATRVSAVVGTIEDAYYLFRAERESRGHGTPADFNPPVHWNELYDNKLFRLPGGKQDDPESRALYYTREDMMQEAAKGVAYHCESLYLDPGWDTNFASKIWDEARLGSAKEFIETIDAEYGLRVSLHTPMSGWCNPTSYAEHTWRMDRFGHRALWSADNSFRHFNSPICGASEEYRRETFERLDQLARAGATFFMFDGTMYNDECWDPDHAHEIPARREAHTESLLELARVVHESWPDVLIEMHDPVVGGFPSHFTPIHYGHGLARSGCGNPRAAGFDTVWAFELMWNPLDDLLNGHAVALYYYNLAYNLPLYVHVDLATDNEHCIVLWWNASTCRHLGIGGTHADPSVVVAQQEAMATYRRLKPFYANGAFYGIDESTHIHTAVDGKGAVINCFNLEDTPVRRELRFDPSRIGLVGGQQFKFMGAALEAEGDLIIGHVDIPAHGHVIIEVVSNTSTPDAESSNQ